MSHVHEKLQALISGELSAAEASAVESHLAQCPACAAEAARQREVWDQLEILNTASPDTSVWPSVRARTFGQKEQTGWFFGGSHMVRGSLAAAAVVAGLMVGMLVPGGTSQVGGEAEALTTDDLQVETAWLEGSSWSMEFTDLQSDWLSAGYDDNQESDGEGS